MCGIAGFSLSAESTIDRTLVAQALLAGIAERGAHAVGFAVARPGGVDVQKRMAGASALLEEIAVPADALHVLLHVRDFTKGHPSVEANNHPIRHDCVVGIHNGVIENDEELFRRFGWQRAEEGMTVDSEAIFASLARAELNDPGAALERLRGTMATAWVDGRAPGLLRIARGARRPLWIASGRRELLFASTRPALLVAARYAGLRLRLSELREGSLLEISEGSVVRRRRFRADRHASRERIATTRAPEEKAACLARLAVIAAVG